MKRMLILLLIVGLVSSVAVYGDIYEQGSLEKLNNSVVTIKNSDYSYRQVFPSTNYSINLPQGSYDLIVERYEAGVLTHSFNESVNVNGKSMRIDFVLEPKAEPTDLTNFILGGVIIGAILLVAYYFMKQPYSKEKKGGAQAAENVELDADSKSVLEAIKANEGRIRQKELRELLNFSDSKMSLVISELEHYGVIKRFKRGRGNIIKIIMK
jgi:uncharacterized membrane protein